MEVSRISVSHASDLLIWAYFSVYANVTTSKSLKTMDEAQMVHMYLSALRRKAQFPKVHTTKFVLYVRITIFERASILTQRLLKGAKGPRKFLPSLGCMYRRIQRLRQSTCENSKTGFESKVIIFFSQFGEFRSASTKC